jgi:hypothetical protein
MILKINDLLIIEESDEKILKTRTTVYKSLIEDEETINAIRLDQLKEA